MRKKIPTTKTNNKNKNGKFRIMWCSDAYFEVFFIIKYLRITKNKNTQKHVPLKF